MTVKSTKYTRRKVNMGGGGVTKFSYEGEHYNEITFGRRIRTFMKYHEKLNKVIGWTPWTAFKKVRRVEHHLPPITQMNEEAWDTCAAYHRHLVFIVSSLHSYAFEHLSDLAASICSICFRHGPKVDRSFSFSFSVSLGNNYIYIWWVSSNCDNYVINCICKDRVDKELLTIEAL